jgi:hypothetical protein
VPNFDDTPFLDLIRIEFFHTLRADAVAEFRFGMIPNIDFYLFPISFVIANLFTGGTYRNKPAQKIQWTSKRV